MRLFFSISLFCLSAPAVKAQLLIAHLPFMYESFFIDAKTDAPYYYKSVTNKSTIIILNADNNTLSFTTGKDNPSEQKVGRIKFDAATKTYTCTAEDASDVRWRGFIFHLNSDNEPDYVLIREINKGRDSKRDTMFTLYTKTLADVHITEKYNLVKTIKDFKESRERYNFYNAIDRQVAVNTDNTIVIENGLIHIKTQYKSGQSSNQELRITNAEIKNTTISSGLIFNAISTDGSDKKYELFYGTYGGLKGGSYKTDARMMYLREYINDEPVDVQLMY